MRRSGAVRSSVIWLVGLLVYFDVVVLVERLLDNTSTDLVSPVVVIAAPADRDGGGARGYCCCGGSRGPGCPSALLTTLGMIL